MLPLSFISCWALLFFGPLFLGGRSRGNRENIFTDFWVYLLEHDELYIGICIIVTITASLIYFAYNSFSSFIVGFDFRDDHRQLVLKKKKGYSNKIHEKLLRYEGLKFIFKKNKSEILNKNYLAITVFNMGKKEGTISSLDVSWLKQEEVMVKLKKKLEEVGKLSSVN